MSFVGMLSFSQRVLLKRDSRPGGTAGQARPWPGQYFEVLL